MENFTKYENIQIDEVCRICLTKKEHMNFIYEAGLADMLLECASVQVTPENGLFNLVCNQCANEVSRWYIFKQQVIRSFEVGRLLLEKKERKTKESNVSALHISSNQNNLKTVVEHNFINQNLSNSNTPMIGVNSDLENVNDLKSLLEDGNKIEGEPQSINFPSYNCAHENEQTIIQNDCSNLNKCRNFKKKNLQCKTCYKPCATTNSYNRHLRTHDSSRPYICSKCDKSFKTSQVLSEHLKRHYDDRRHMCTLCGQKYYAKSSLSDHMRSHTGEKPFNCNVCERAFGTKAILRQHQIVHTIREKKFRCEICSKYLLTAGSLETHKRKHTGIKPFPCSSCDKQFFTKEAMQRHFGAIHDIDNNFLCSVCSK
ncbi:hypothetical protein NQ314_000999, partial [Rhamnusium bicolor]